MRLINADTENGKLLDFIAEHDTSIQYALEHKDMTILEDIFFEYFEAQKIAYDVDKVVEEIKKCDYCDSDRYLEPEAVITIVKDGWIREGKKGELQDGGKRVF